MNYLNCENYVEVKDRRYKIHPTEKIIFAKTPTSLRTQYQVQKGTRIRKNQKFVENNGELEVKNDPKNKQPVIQNQKRKLKLPNFPSCKQNTWLKFDKG